MSSYTKYHKAYYTKNKKEIVEKNYKSLKLRRLKAKEKIVENKSK